MSTHGGRQLDGAVAALDALPEVVAAVPSECEVLVDGGSAAVRTCSRRWRWVRAVLVGRPVLWGLAVDGAAGVERVLSTLRAELEEAMALTGRPRLDTLTPDLLHHSPRPCTPPHYERQGHGMTNKDTRFTLTAAEQDLLPSDDEVQFYQEHGWYLSEEAAHR